MKKATLLLMAAFILALTSCDKSNDDNTLVEVLLNQTQLAYDSVGVWTGAMDPTAQVVSQGIQFSHSAVPAWNSWTGFVASRNRDTTDYSAQNWLEHQFAAITGGGKSGTGTPYFVAYWNSSEVVNSLADASCSFCKTDSAEFTPVSMLVSNTTYTYYAMLNGTNWSKKFAKGDWLKLSAYGIAADGQITGPVETYLADYRTDTPSILKGWTYVNLEALGKVKGVFFAIDSSDKGEWGINTPTYFAVDRIIIDTNTK